MAVSLTRLFSGLRISPVMASTKLLFQQNTANIQSKHLSKCITSSKCTNLTTSAMKLNCCKMTSRRTFSSLKGCQSSAVNDKYTAVSRMLMPAMPTIAVQRSKTKFSMCKGKAKTVHSVVKRFYRLSWGAWIRPRVGRRKRLWTKNKGRKIRLQQHVFCNRQQSRLLDKMVTSFWTRRKYYVDDPYEPYEKRTNFPEVPEKCKMFYP